MQKEERVSPTKRLIQLKNQKTPPRARKEQKSGEFKSFADRLVSGEKKPNPDPPVRNIDIPNHVYGAPIELSPEEKEETRHTPRLEEREAYEYIPERRGLARDEASRTHEQLLTNIDISHKYETRVEEKEEVDYDGTSNIFDTEDNVRERKISSEGSLERDEKAELNFSKASEEIAH